MVYKIVGPCGPSPLIQYTLGEYLIIVIIFIHVRARAYKWHMKRRFESKNNLQYGNFEHHDTAISDCCILLYSYNDTIVS